VSCDFESVNAQSIDVVVVDDNTPIHTSNPLILSSLPSIPRRDLFSGTNPFVSSLLLVMRRRVT